MEPMLIEVYRGMLKAHPDNCSVDRILEDPELRGEFLGLVRADGAPQSEFEILHGLTNLRKRNKLPRRDD
ncbi:MAG: AAA-like domain-containing protein [Planctomycetia bacterium]|nr:AAA-like domain-containing protein [Planctomycetia bacterium]